MGRESGNFVQQIGVETVPGTSVPATNRFAGLVFEIGETTETKQARRMGAKFDTSSIIHKEWCQGRFSGPISYVESVYVFAGLWPFVVTPGGSASQTWDFIPNSAGSDDAKTFTIEDGDEEATERYPGVTIQSVDLNFSREDAQMSGSCFGLPLENLAANAITSLGVADLADRAVSGKEIDFYVDDSFAAIGTTKLTDAFEANFSFTEKRQPKWVMNTSYPSYKEGIEVRSDSTLNFLTEHNAQSRAFFDSVKLNATKFFRVKCTGDLIGGGIRHLLQVDFCGKIRNKEKVRDFNGVYAYRYTLGGFQETTMNRAFALKVINKLVSL